MKIHLLRSWAYAAQEAHLYELAFMKYERLAEMVATLLQAGELDFIQEDAYCFLSNIYRNQAYTRLWVCAPESARMILERDAIPLLNRYTAPFETPAVDQNETNWREMHLFILWELCMAIAWQSKLSDEPRLFDQDLFDGYENILVAAKLSQAFPAGRDWTAALYCYAAEVCIMRCEMASNRGMQSMLCALADEHLQRVERLRHDDLTTATGRLRAMTLDFPRYQLAVRRHIIFDTVDRMDDIITELIALRQKTEAVDDASYRLFSARCLLLLGTIEIELQKTAQMPDVTHARHAENYLQQGLDLLDRRPESGLDGLFEREILLKMDILHTWLP